MSEETNTTKKFDKGKYVETIFSTCGELPLYGKIIKSGHKEAFILWETGFRNRVKQNDSRINVSSNQSLAKEEFYKLGFLRE